MTLRISLLKLLAAAPLPILYRLTGPLYTLLFHMSQYKRSITEKNIQNSFPHLNQAERKVLIKRFYRNFCEVILEILKTIQLKPQQLNEHIRFKNINVIQQALEKDQTIILALTHQCNMEWPVLALGERLRHPIDGIYKPLRQTWLNELTIESCSKFNITLIPAKTCITDLITRSKQTRVIAIAPDQAPRRRDDAYWTVFLNQETPFYLGLAKIATLFKYPVYFMEVERTERGKYTATFKLLCSPPYAKESSSISEAYVRATEKQILKHPEDWLWTHKRWKKKKSLYD